MEFNVPVSNPMLVGAIELLKAEDTPGHRSMFVGELQKASLLAPALVDPEPVEDGEGKLKITPGSKVQFPMLTSSDGKWYYMGFTDKVEYRKWQEKNRELPFFALKFEDYARMLFGRDSQGNICSALGFVINPYGANLVVQKQMVAGVMAARAAQAKKQAGAPPMQKLRINVPGGGESKKTAEQGTASVEGEQEKLI